MPRKVDQGSSDKAAPGGTGDKQPAGRVEFDSRGNSVWRWTAEENDESTSILLKRLENDELELEPTRTVPVQPPGGSDAARHGKPRRGRAEPAAGTGAAGSGSGQRQGSSRVGPGARANDSGFDPYNHG